tara:strand:- start:8500 stop:9480 length:981 start_codon:yes stop_codon:yes gene_type:complete
MDTRELARIDLNLLISLQVLLEEGSVSRAAERLFITQPAMSKTLSRLRHLFGDQLFTRTRHGMQPTPRAEQLVSGLAEVLGDIGQLLAQPGFDPHSFKGEITLALSEYIGVALLPRLMQRLGSQSPQLNLRVITRVENQLDELALGNLDFAVHIRQAHYSNDFRVEELGESPPAILVRDTHPLAEGTVTWERLAKYPLIRLYVSDWEQLELQRNAEAIAPLIDHPMGTLEISHLLTAMEVLRQTDYFLPGPAYVLQNNAAMAGITGLPVPMESQVGLSYALVAHKRTINSPLHNWLWEEITCTIRELRTSQQYKLRQRIPADRIGN